MTCFFNFYDINYLFGVFHLIFFFLKKTFKNFVTFSLAPYKKFLALPLMMPPCGVADITNGTNWMCSSKKKHHHSRDSLHTVSHYTFFQGNPKWPSSKYHLTYGFLHGTPTEAMSPVAKAFETWAANTHFRFSRAQDHTNADIKVSFHRRDHGDGHAFD